MDPATLIRAWFREVWDEGSEEAIDRLLAPHTRMYGLAGAEIVGPEQFKPYFRTMRAAFGDLEIKVLRTLVEGDTVAAHCRVTARHIGESLGAPTGNPVQFEGMTIVRAENGKLVEGWNCFDFLSMYQQLGWVPNPVGPTG
jgi:predicted ester cyclase